jgi:predicted Zn-dependent peptidase
VPRPMLLPMHTVAYRRLDNGLRLVTIHRPHLHSLVLTAMVHVGSRHETRATNGLSHFLEHMLFRGTARHPSAAAFNEAVEDFGASLNAATHGDFTSFVVSAPPTALRDACDALAELLTTPVFSDLAVEKRIVREEILEDLDEDGRDVNADNVVRAQLFGSHPLGYPITGSTHNVARFTVEHLRRHVARHYQGDNMVVALAGPLSHARMEAAAAQAFGIIPAGPATPSPPFAVVQPRARLKAVSHPGSQTAVRLAFPTVGAEADDARAVELLLRVLDDGMSTRLHRRICDELGMAYEVSAGVEFFEETGIVDVAASVAKSSIGALVGEVLTLLADLAVAGPSPAEVAKAQRRYAFDLDTLEDDPHSLCDFYGIAELFGRRQSPAERRKEMLALDAERLRAAGRRLFDPARLNVTLVGAADAATLRTTRAAMQAFADRVGPVGAPDYAARPATRPRAAARRAQRVDRGVPAS